MFATKTREHDKIVLEQGIAQGLMDSVKRLKRKGFSASEISELLEIPIKEVEEAVKL